MKAREIALYVGVVLAGVLIVAGIWIAGVALSGPVGAGEAHKQKENADNRIFANEQFQKLNAEYEATIAKLGPAKSASTTSDEAEVRYQGLQQHCADVAADYNAAARSYRTQDFRTADLPESLDSSACTEGTTP